MKDPVILATVGHGEDGLLRVIAPCIGWWRDPPHRGAWVGPGSSIGTIRQLNRRYRLVLPDGAAGRVSGDHVAHHVNAVQYGQLLFTLQPVESVQPDDDDEDRAVLGHPPGAGLPDDVLAVVAPTDGVFYRRSSPDSPPFVEPGSKVRLGEAVGLVEVMKTFNQIVYDGPGFPQSAEVVEVRVEDGEEVRAGQVLIVVR